MVQRQGGIVLPSWLRALIPAALLIAVQQIVWPMPVGTLASGVIIGSLAALNALGLALIWRANHIINFSQADLGTLPATFVVLTIEVWKLPYLAAAGLGVISAVVCGAIVELAFVRRFFSSSRLILTITTVGISQLLGVAAILLPRIWDKPPANRTFAAPFAWTTKIGSVIFDANDLIAALVAPALLIALVLFLRRTSVGIAVRAAAEGPDRAAMLGIPVKRLQTVVWVIAAVLSFASVFLTAGITSLTPGFGVSLLVLLRSLAALVIGRMNDLLTIATSAIALGIVESGIRWNSNDTNLLAPMLTAVILVALMLQRRGSTRADDDAATWSVSVGVRGVPAELARLSEVRLVRWAAGLITLGLVVWFPNVAGTGTALKGGAVLVFATVGISLVVLTGWAGLVSLAQMAFVGAGGAVAAWAVVTQGYDPALAILLGGLAGALTATIVGLPALRLRGLYLAVVTLGLALSFSSAVFNNAYVDWIPVGTFDRPTLFNRIRLDSATRVYYLALVVLILAALAVTGLRHSRTGRVLQALRDNERAAAAFGISVTRAKLTAFAISGFIAASAGSVFVIHQASFRSESYDAGSSIQVFASAVIGGLGSVTGAVVGALYTRGAGWLLPGDWQFVASASGALLVLMILPSGLSGLLFRLRDAWLRWVAARHGIVVTTLRRVAETPGTTALDAPIPAAGSAGGTGSAIGTAGFAPPSSPGPPDGEPSTSNAESAA